MKEFIQTGKPFLGICVGYQALFEKSEEFNSCAAGLGVFAGKVVRFHRAARIEDSANRLEPAGESRAPDCPLYRGIPERQPCLLRPQLLSHSRWTPAIVATRTEHGDVFASSVWKDNVFATQFHPEKSQDVGLRLLKNFVELPR